VKSAVLLTGATGFVGGFIAQELVDAGYGVHVTVRKRSDFGAIKHLELTYTELDLLNPSAIADYIDQFSIKFIIHNAGLTRHKCEEELNSVNAIVIKNFASAYIQAKHKFEKIIFISSLAAYGPADLQSDGLVSRNSVPKPITAYGRSKLLGESYLKSTKAPYIILRPTAVYGPREKDLLTVFKMISKGLEVTLGGQQKLSFVYVKDLARGVVKALAVNMPFDEYFVTDGKNYTNLELNAAIRGHLNVKTLKFNLPLWILKVISQFNERIAKISGYFPVVNSDKYNELAARSWYCDSKDFWSHLGTSPGYHLDEGVKETVNWYKTNKWI
jgi:UDP-glucose 4-epimerase